MLNFLRRLSLSILFRRLRHYLEVSNWALKCLLDASKLVFLIYWNRLNVGSPTLSETWFTSIFCTTSKLSWQRFLPTLECLLNLVLVIFETKHWFIRLSWCWAWADKVRFANHVSVEPVQTLPWDAFQVFTLGNSFIRQTSTSVIYGQRFSYRLGFDISTITCFKNAWPCLINDVGPTIIELPIAWFNVMSAIDICIRAVNVIEWYDPHVADRTRCEFFTVTYKVILESTY